MTLIYEDESHTREDLERLRRQNQCKVCGGMLNIFLDMNTHRAYLACNDDQSHEGIERESKPPVELNIPSWREEMEEKHTKETTDKLVKYHGVTTLAKEEALSLFDLLWPEAPYNDRLKAAIIAHQYGLNPLMKHIALIKFNKYNRQRQVVGENWAVIQEIASNRIIAQRKHHYSYLDLSPRRMTEEEQMKVNGEVDNNKIWAITIIKDLDTRAEFTGVGSWPADEEPYGVEKGNTKLNMAKIRSERNALNIAYPAELPQGIDVIDERYAEGTFTSLPEGGDKIGGLESEGGREATSTTILSPPRQEISPKTAPSAEPATVQGKDFNIDSHWLTETQKALRWTDDTMLSFLASPPYKVIGKTIAEAVSKLTREQAEDFTKQLNNRLQQYQTGFWK